MDHRKGRRSTVERWRSEQTTAAATGYSRSGGPKKVRIAKTGDPAPSGTFTSLLELPAISGSTVAFRGNYSSGNGGSSLTTADRQQRLPRRVAIQHRPVHLAAFLFAFLIANSGDGTVAFRGDYAGGNGHIHRLGGALTTIAKSGDPAPSGTFTDVGFVPAVSSGLAAFRGSYMADFKEFSSAMGGHLRP